MELAKRANERIDDFLVRATRLSAMADELDVDAMIARFRERAAAVRERPLPPVAGAERQRFVEQAQRDFQDFAIIGDATWEFTDGVLTLRVDLTAEPVARTARRDAVPASRASRSRASDRRIRPERAIVSGPRSARRAARSGRGAGGSARSTATQIVFENG